MVRTLVNKNGFSNQISQVSVYILKNDLFTGVKRYSVSTESL